MTFKPPFPPAAKEYIRLNMDEWPSVLAYKVGVLFGYPCTKEGIKRVIQNLKRQPVLSSAG